jgi:hypothetical protein
MVNRGDTLGWKYGSHLHRRLGTNVSSSSPWWQNLPPDEQMGWRIPIEIMIDLEHLRKTHSVLLVREYLAMHGLNQTLESVTGKWEPELYHSGMKTSIPHKDRLSIFSVPSEDYDPPHLVLVDSLQVSSNSSLSASVSANDGTANRIYNAIPH